MLQPEAKLDTVSKIDKHVWARVPEVVRPADDANPEEWEKHKTAKQLKELVKKHMVHSPCQGGSTMLSKRKLAFRRQCGILPTAIG